MFSLQVENPKEQEALLSPKPTGSRASTARQYESDEAELEPNAQNDSNQSLEANDDGEGAPPRLPPNLPPRLFVIRADGTAYELLRARDVDVLLEKAKNDKNTVVVEEPLITVTTPAPALITENATPKEDPQHPVPTPERQPTCLTIITKELVEDNQTTDIVPLSMRAFYAEEQTKPPVTLLHMRQVPPFVDSNGHGCGDGCSVRTNISLSS